MNVRLEWLVLAAFAGVATAGPDADHEVLWAMEPAISTDGRTIVVPYHGEDGARAAQNLALRIYDRKGTLVKFHVVQTVEQCAGNACVPDDTATVQKQERAAARVLRALRTQKGLVPLAIVRATKSDPTHLEAPEIGVDLSVTGTLTIRYHGNDSCWEPDSERVVMTW